MRGALARPRQEDQANIILYPSPIDASIMAKSSLKGKCVEHSILLPAISKKHGEALGKVCWWSLACHGVSLMFAHLRRYSSKNTGFSSEPTSNAVLSDIPTVRFHLARSICIDAVLLLHSPLSGAFVRSPLIRHGRKVQLVPYVPHSRIA